MVNYLTENNDIFHDENDFYIYDTSKGLWQEVHPNILGKKILKGLGNKAKTIHAKDALNLLEYQTYIPPETLRPDNLLINMKNKMLDLQYMKLIPHDKKYYSRLQTPIDYDPDAKCPLLDRSLSQIFRDDPDKTITIQQFAGYCLYAEIFIHKCLFLIGEGGNGKSTIIEIISRLVGSDHVTSLNLTMLADKFMLGTLKNSMLNISTEIETREPIADHIFKQVVSGDRVQADVKYGKPFSFYPIAKHVFSMNRIPIITDRSFAIKRRLIVLQCNQKFDGPTDDKQLKEKLWKELPGIFNWALRGLIEVMKNKCIFETEKSKKEKEDFIKFLNPIMGFIEEECEVNPQLMAYKDEFYKKYKEWCHESGIRSMSKIKFYHQLLVDYPMVTEKKEQGGARYFDGIGIRNII